MQERLQKILSGAGVCDRQDAHRTVFDELRHGLSIFFIRHRCDNARRFVQHNRVIALMSADAPAVDANGICLQICAVSHLCLFPIDGDGTACNQLFRSIIGGHESYHTIVCCFQYAASASWLSFLPRTMCIMVKNALVFSDGCIFPCRALIFRASAVVLFSISRFFLSLMC